MSSGDRFGRRVSRSRSEPVLAGAGGGFVGHPPFLEQRPLIDAVNLDWSIREAPEPTFSGTGIATLWCPSDVGSWCRLRELPRIGGAHAAVTTSVMASAPPGGPVTTHAPYC
jgi:hypothetical protein